MEKNEYKKPIVVAEIGCNHMGEISTAKEMIKMAKIFCNVDVIKFQKRDVETWTELKPELYNGPHPNPINAFGKTYKDHRSYLEFSIDDHSDLKQYCEKMGIEYSTSVWDLKSAMGVTGIDPKRIKIPSACNNNYEMLDWLCKNYKGEIHVSTGMTTQNEIDKIVSFFKENKRNSDLVLYNCISGYPVPFKDVRLMEISNLKEKYGKQVKAIGFSGHHLGIAIDIAAYTLGATWFERHYTLDRTWKGTDHSASLEPNGLRKLVRDLNATKKSLLYKGDGILPIEEEQRSKLKLD